MEDLTPIIIGGGQFTQKGVDPLLAHPPMGIAAEAAKAALADTGQGEVLAKLIDTLLVIRIFPDSSNRPRMQIPFGRAENPPRAVARRIGANPVNAIYGNVGGNTPQKYISEMAERIASGDVEVALLTGSEAIETARTAIRNNIQLDWQEDDSGSLEDRGIGETMMTPHEFAHGIGIPIQTYPLFENAIRGQLGHSVEEHMLAMGELFAPFSEIAADNPYSSYGVRRSAEDLATVTKENRFIGFPYPKWMNAMDGVNQGAAVVMTSVARAKELGVDPTRWIFLHGCSEANEKILISERVNYYSSPAIAANSAQALDMAGKSIKDIAHIDIYSCFPSAVEISARELGLELDDFRGFTVTGGLPFFGGPGNNYSMHAIASMIPLLRNKPKDFGLVTANGGYLSKHATGIYSATPAVGNWEKGSSVNIQQSINSMTGPEFTETPSGSGTIETYTVVFRKGNPEKGIIIGRLGQCGRRFIANTPIDDRNLNLMLESDCLGVSGEVTSNNGLNTFTFN